MKTFGNKFRKERERLRYSIEDVASVTKIGARMLKAIEDEHFDELPGGIFNKGFIRAYAKHLGMNPEEAITEYLACMQQRQMDAIPAAEPVTPARTRAAGKNQSSSSQVQTRPAQIAQSPIKEELPHLQLPKAEHVRPPKRDFPSESDSRIPWKLLAVAAITITLAAILWTRHAHRVHAESTKSAKSAESMTLHTVEAAAPAPAANPGDAYKEVASRKDSSTKIRSRENASQENRSQQKAAPEKTSEENNPASVPTTTSASTTNPAEPLTLIIRATENSWISITADGQPIAHETLIAPAHTTVRATREITVRTGNAAGLTFLLNGKEILPQGAESEVKTLIFNTDGLAHP